jgi:thiamine transporter
VKERENMSFLVKKIVDASGVTYSLTGAGYTVLIILCIALLAIGYVVRDSNKKINAKHIALAAMAMALAVVTSMIKVIKLPMGGSATLFSMLFIVLIGYWYGIKTGLTTSLAYGVLQLLLDPYILNIPQVLLDYILGFGALGLSGFFSKSKHGLVKGYIVGVIGRFICSFLSGWIFFAVYTPEFFNSAVLYSIVYNGSYIGLEAVITLIVISLPPVNKALAYVKNNLV